MVSVGKTFCLVLTAFALAGDASAADPERTCVADAQCEVGSICQSGRCVRFEKPTRILLYRRDGASTRLLPFYFFRMGETGHRIVAPVYWHTWGPDDMSRIVAPLYFHFESPGRALTVVPPYVHSIRGESESWAVWPFFYLSNRDGWFLPPLLSYRIDEPATGRSRGLYGLLYYWSRDPVGRRDLDLLFPLFASVRKPDSSSTWVFPLNFFWRDSESSGMVAFPLAYASRGPDHSTTVVGNVFHHRNGPTSTTGIVPLAFWGKNREKDTSWGTILPLAYWRRDPYSLTVGTPVGYWYRDPDTRSAAWFLPPIVHHRSPVKEVDSVLGLYWRSEDRVRERTTTVLFPFFLRRSTPTEKLTAVGVAPLLAYRGIEGDGGRTAGLFPFAFFRTGGERPYAFIPPFLFHIHDRERSNTVLFPLFQTSRSPRGSDGTVPLALLFWGSNKDSAYAVQFPFFWHFRAGKDSTTLLLPFLYRKQTARTSFLAAGVGPIWYFDRRKYERHEFGLFPLAYFLRTPGSSSSVVLPLFAHWGSGQDRTTVLFPLLSGRSQTATSDAGGILPLLFFWNKDETNTTLVQVPFFWHFADREAETSTTVVPPFFARRRDPEGSFHAAGIAPLMAYWSRNADGKLRAGGLSPFFFFGSNGEHRYTVVSPLYFDFVSPERRITAALPLFYRSRTADSSAGAVFPLLLFWGRSPDSSYTVQVPFFWRVKEADQTTTVVPPFLVRRTSPGKSLTIAGIPPALAYFGRDGDGVSAGLFPLVFVRSGERSHQVVFPLFWRFADRTSSSTTFAPLFHHASGKDRSSTAVFPLLTSWGRTGDASYAVQFPFFWRFRDVDRESTTLFPLFHHRKDATGSGLYTLLAGARSNGDDRFWYAGPFLRSRGKDRDTTAVVPLGWSATDRAAGTRSQFCLPLLHYAAHSPTDSFSTTLLLHWQHADQESSQRLLLPFYYQFDRPGVARTTVLLPLYARHRNETDDTTTTLLPFFYRRQNKQDTTTVGFPFYWSFQSPERGTSMLLPFYVHLRRPAWRATYVFPNVYYRAGQGAAAGTSELHVFPFWEQATRRPGDTFWQALLGLVGYERIGRNRYVKVFFIPFEITPAPAAQADWYGRGSRQTARGLDTHVW